MSKPSKVNYTPLDPSESTSAPLYALMNDLIATHHPHLADARLGIAWHDGLKPNPDGQLVLGRCLKVADPHRELHGLDFIVVLNRQAWGTLSDFQRKALMDHELCHAARAETKEGEPKEDERGRPVWRTRRHDLEEFGCIAHRYGLYKSDLEAFVRTAVASENRRTAGGGTAPTLFDPDAAAGDREAV